MRQIKLIIFICAAMTILALLLLWSFLALFLAFTDNMQPKIVVHKAMNYNQYNVVIISKAHFTRIAQSRQLFANVWLNNKKIASHSIFELSVINDYNEKIKDITILSNSEKIKVEFAYPGHSKSRTGVDLYNLE